VPATAGDEERDMAVIERLYHVCLTVRPDPAAYRREVEFYRDFLGMSFEPVPMSQEGWEQMYAGLGGNEPEGEYDGDVGFLRGQQNRVEDTLIDLVSFRTPRFETEPSAALNRIGLRGPTLLVDDLDRLHARGVASGIRFLSEPVTAGLPGLGQLRFVVASDPEGCPVELIQSPYPGAQGRGSVERVFSVNINCADLERALELYRDELGMQVRTRVSLAGASGIGRAFGFGPDVQAESCLLTGENQDGATFLNLVEWRRPEPEGRPDRGEVGNAWFRMCLYVDDVDALYEGTRDRLRFLAPPFTFEMGQYGPTRVVLFLDHDGVLQEYLNVPGLERRGHARV
jgi:catechol 2,3-dioxygenase-like lactoylglutathione lyase family enzyme